MAIKSVGEGLSYIYATHIPKRSTPRRTNAASLPDLLFIVYNPLSNSIAWVA